MTERQSVAQAESSIRKPKPDYRIHAEAFNTPHWRVRGMTPTYWRWVVTDGLGYRAHSLHAYTTASAAIRAGRREYKLDGSK